MPLWVLLAQTSPSTTEPSATDQFFTDHRGVIAVVALVLFTTIGLVLVYGTWFRARRQRSMAPTAARHGFRYSPVDIMSSTAVAFPLFRAGEGRRVTNLMWREGCNGFPVRSFDYAYYDEISDPRSIETPKEYARRSWHHFSCGLAQHNGAWPTLRVTRERRMDSIGRLLGLETIELESEEFNRLFVVQCEDPKFATAFLDPQMMELLISTEAKVDLQTKGRWLLMTATRVDTADELIGLAGLADEVVRRIPPVLWDLYPKGPDADTSVALEERTGLLQPAEGMVEALADQIRAERDDEARPEYDLDGNPIEPREERPWG